MPENYPIEYAKYSLKELINHLMLYFELKALKMKNNDLDLLTCENDTVLKQLQESIKDPKTLNKLFHLFNH